MSEFPQVKVGDEVLYVTRSYSGQMREPVAVRVSKVGRKYFSVSPIEGHPWAYDREQFYLDSGYEKTDGNYPARIVTHEILAAEERRKLVLKRLLDAGVDFRYGRAREFTTEQLAAAATALGLEQ